MDKDVIKSMVRDSINRQIDQKLMVVDDTDNSQPDNSQPDNTDDNSEEADPSSLNESLSVVGFMGSKEVASSKIKSLKELNKMAKTGQFDRFVVTKDGKDVDYSVVSGRLVEI